MKEDQEGFGDSEEGSAVATRENPFALTKPEIGGRVVKAEVDTQIATAHAYPRDFNQFIKEAMFEATYSAEVAEEMWYSRPVDDQGKEIEGPSIRLAEILAKAYGNLKFGFDIIGHDGKMIKAEGWCWDLEKNNEARVTVTRRITTKQGRIFGDSMIQTTGLAAGSIALRNAIFKIIPKVFVSEVLNAAQERYKKSAEKDLEASVGKALKWFEEQDIGSEIVLKMLERESVMEITADDVVKLRGTMTAIRGGDLTVAEVKQKYGANAGSRDDDAPSLTERIREQKRSDDSGVG